MPLTEDLHRLEAGGLIRMATAPPELEYLFRHVMVQDAAYATLVRVDRRMLHLAAGEALESLFPNWLHSRELAPLLGRHFLEAGDGSRALGYFVAAGSAALAIYANAEAANYYAQAVHIVKQLPASAGPAPAEMQALWLKLGQALEGGGRYAEAIAAYQELQQFGREGGDWQLEIAGLLAQVNVRSIPSKAFEPEQGRVLAEQALALAHQFDDRATEAQVLWYQMLQQFFTGRHGEVRSLGEQALALARELDLKELQASILNDLAGFVYIASNEYERGLAALTEAGALWRGLGNLHKLADNLATSAYNEFVRADFEHAITLVNEASQVVQQTGSLWGRAYCAGVRGQIYAESGEFDVATPELEEAIRVSELAFAGAQVIARNVLAIQYCWLGDAARGWEIARNVVALAEAHVPFWVPQAFACRVMMHLRLGKLEEAAVARRPLEDAPRSVQLAYSHYVMMADCEYNLAVENYPQVIDRADLRASALRGSGLLAFVPYLLHYKGLALERLAQAQTARLAQQEACTLAGAHGSRHMGWRTLGALARLEQAAGREAEARTARGQARAVVEQILSHIPDTGLRKKFQALPEMRDLVE